MVPALVDDMLGATMVAVGPYELREPIGDEGRAQVFRALAPDGQEVALKLLRGGAGASEAELARFEREIQLAESLDHPHLIRVIDHGVDEARGPWLTMPLLRAMTMRDLFGGKTLCPTAAVAIVYPVIDALAALHAAGLVHRDVRPENVLLSPLGDVTLVDLGVALSDTDARVMKAGEIAGSARYMSPERIEGRDVDPSADVWAVGAILYELVTGARPFEREAMRDEVDAILDGTLTPMADVDARVGKELDWLVTVCLATDPWKRPRDGAVLLGRVRPLMFGALDKARETRVSVLSDPDAFEQRVVRDRARSEARAETIERAPEVASPAPRRWRFVVAPIVLALVAGVAVSWLGDEETEQVTAPPSADVGELDSGVDAAIEGTALRFVPIPPDLLIDVDPRGRTRDAYEDLVRVLRIDPDDVHALAEMTEIFERVGRARDSLPFLRRIVETQPTNIDAWVSLSVILSESHEARDIDAAVEAIERAISLDVDHVRAQRQRCTLFSSAEQPGAIPACTEAISRAPESPGLFVARAVALSREERHVPALADADRAIELQPRRAHLYAARATLRENAGDESGALIDHRVACQLGHEPSCERMGGHAPPP